MRLYYGFRHFWIALTLINFRACKRDNPEKPVPLARCHHGVRSPVGLDSTRCNE
jgi:hypothetical protein